jgi:hypothetical protein
MMITITHSDIGGCNTKDLHAVYDRVQEFLRYLEQEIDARHEIQVGMSVSSIEQELILDANEKAYHDWRDQQFSCAVGEYDI